MDILSLVSKEQLAEFTSELNYDYGFMGTQLFPQVKSDNLQLTYAKLVEGGNVPVMAQVHALDTEARIGDRPNFETYKLDKALIKEKINLTERIIEFLGQNPKAERIVDFIFDDVSMLAKRCITRTEVANMELLSTGKVTYKENNVTLEIDYGVPSGNKIALTGWDNPSKDILGDLETIKKTARKKGYALVRAYTSSTMLGYMQANTKIQSFFANANMLMTELSMKAWLMQQFGIDFVVNDDVYKTSALGTQTYRFFDEQTITFVPVRTSLGQGLFGLTPEERFQLEGIENKGVVTSLNWEEKDPAGIWNKCSCVYVPALSDVNSLFICKHTPTEL